MRALHKLSAVKARTAPPGKYSDGGGLWLHKRSDGGAQWVLRVTVHGNRREMGLGRAKLDDSRSSDGLTLKEAREAADKWRSVARSDKDPIKERERERREAARERHTLNVVADEAFEARKAELKGDGKAGRWFTPLELHVLPRLGKTPIEDIDQNDIKLTLAPIWHEKADTARKAMNRLGIVMRHAAAMGLDVDLQATEKAKALLGKSRHVAKNVPALPWQEVPNFYKSLSEATLTQLALKLLILTGLRSMPIRHARLDQIDGEVWTVPAEYMKGLKGKAQDFRVPLSKEALAVMEQARPFARDGWLFPNVRKGVLSDATMSRYMERLEMDARPHGFRSSFRTWCAEATDVPREVAEAALAHATGSAVERAYRRTDFLEQRRALMERWADHVTGGSGKVVRMVG
ncbi:site-specific integrase [Silicimonas algicola]|uniref:Integrase n=1 Tax=Silicimonas algicola TaxID=1826607 RepID=A0A316G7D6_9RHOB|nr:site-specific integrase [Silicimonas algicola]AZQ69500.1 site-specific integrase [Silicimonas algicola]PWK56573.1 integrase [Silicimonas algicola]